MEVSELLLKKACEYEVLAASYSERASFDAENGRAAVGFTLAALVLPELAEVLDEAA